MARTEKKRGRPKRRDEAVGPTPETAAKLEPDVLLGLTEAGVLTLEQERAGREIADVWRALMRGFFGTFNPDGARLSGRVREPVDAMTQGEARIYATTYLPWAKQEVRALVVNFPKLTRCDLAYRVCAANQSPETVARAFQVDRFALIQPLRDGLDNYLRFIDARERRKAG
jgi:hypothetical protein